MEIGKNIRRVRELRGLMQKDVAIALKISPSNYNRIETGEREPSIEMLIKIAKLFGVTLDELVDFDKINIEISKVEDESSHGLFILIQGLDEEDKKTLHSVVNSMINSAQLKSLIKQGSESIRA